MPTIHAKAVFPSRDLEHVLEQALYAPSGDNCQAWIFEWSDETLIVREDVKRAKHVMNNNSHASLLACGMLLEHIDIAASAIGYQTSVVLDDELFRDDNVMARVGFKRDESRPADPLVALISKRHTDRRTFKKTKLPPSLHSMIEELRRRYPEVSVNWVENSPKDFLCYNVTSEALIADVSDLLRDLLHWIRFTKESVNSTRDGLPVANLAVSVMDGAALRLMRKFSFLIPICAKLMKPALTKKARTNFENSSIIAFGIAQQNAAHQLNVGRVIARVWLHLSKENFAVQPHTSGVLPVFDLHAGTMCPKIPKRYWDHYAKAQELYARTFQWKENTIPIFQIRTGTVEQALDFDKRTKRRPLSHFFAEYNAKDVNQQRDLLCEPRSAI